MNNPTVFIIIPNWNGLKHLSYSLPSLAKTTYPNFQAILVDDASTDGSIDFVKRNYPSIKIIKNNINKGFAGAVNEGIKFALDQGAEYIAVFNSDIRVIPKWVEPVIDIMKKQLEVGLVGYTEIPKEREDLFYGAKDLKLEYRQVKRLLGALIICPSIVFRNVGLFDEAYFMYGEGNDFSSRLIRAGYVILETNIPVWHHFEGSSQKRRFRATWLEYRNAIRFVIKNESLLGILRMVLALLYRGCNPFLTRKPDDPVLKRLRRYNIFVTFGLIIGSFCWNVLNIIPTLKARHKANRHIKRGLAGSRY